MASTRGFGDRSAAPLTRDEALSVVRRVAPFFIPHENIGVEARAFEAAKIAAARDDADSTIGITGARRERLEDLMLLLELEIDAGNLSGAFKFIERADVDADVREELSRHGVRYLTEKVLTDDYYTMGGEKPDVDFVGMVVQQFFPNIKRPDYVRELYRELVKPIVLDVAERLTHAGEIDKLIRLFEISEFDTSRTEALLSSAIQNAGLLGRHEDVATGAVYMALHAEDLEAIFEPLLRGV